MNYYLTQAGLDFLEEELSKRQKLAIGTTAALTTMFGASRVGGRGSLPNPPAPRVVQQHQTQAGPVTLQTPPKRKEAATTKYPRMQGIDSTEHLSDPAYQYMQTHSNHPTNPSSKRLSNFKTWYMKEKGLKSGDLDAHKEAEKAFYDNIRKRNKK